MESSDEESVAAAAILLSLKGKLEARKKATRKRTRWTKPWIGNRLSMGAYHALLQELKESDNQGFANFVRMDIESFELLLVITQSSATDCETRHHCDFRFHLFFSFSFRFKNIF